jgi:hypothetical protein
MTTKQIIIKIIMNDEFQEFPETLENIKKELDFNIGIQSYGFYFNGELIQVKDKEKKQ